MNYFTVDFDCTVSKFHNGLPFFIRGWIFYCTLVAVDVCWGHALFKVILLRVYFWYEALNTQTQWSKTCYSVQAPSNLVLTQEHEKWKFSFWRVL